MQEMKRRYLSMYIPAETLDDQFNEHCGVCDEQGIEEAVLADRDYKYDGKVIKISKKNFSKVHRDFKNPTKGKETMITYDSKEGTVLVPVEFTEEVEIEEAKEFWAVIDKAKGGEVMAISSDEKGAKSSVKMSNFSKHDYHFGKDPRTLKIVKVAGSYKQGEKMIGTKLSFKEEIEKEARTYKDRTDDDEKKKKKHFAFGGKKKSRHGESGYGKGEEVDREFAEAFKEEIELEERKMTDAEMAEREEIVKKLKPKLQSFKDRYGDDAKKVMYATATKQAMEEVEIEEKKSATGYELYHKTFSDAMQHAYAHAKSKGFVVDPKEIDDKVATGPKKPSSGKTNRYSLKAGRKKVEIQVANLDNKRYELNMYIEAVELDEAFSMGKGDKRVVDAFYDQKEIKAHGASILTTDGKTLTKRGMGGQDIAKWVNGKIKIVAVSDVKSTELILKYMKKSIPSGVFEEMVIESTKEYAKSLEKIAKDKQLKMLTKSERENLLKIADLLAKERKEEVEIEEDRGDDEHRELVQFKARWLMKQALKSGKRQNRDWWKKQARIAGLGNLSPAEAMVAISDTKKEEVEIDEAEIATSIGSGGTAGLDLGLNFKKKKDDVKKAKALRKQMVGEEVQRTTFAGKDVFIVDSETYYNCRLGKKKYGRYEKYVGNGEVGQTIREYGLKYPRRPIILQNGESGPMLFLKYGRS